MLNKIELSVFSSKIKIIYTWLHKISKEQLAIILLLMTICIFFPLLIYRNIRCYSLPIGGDTGSWLKASYALFGIDYPMWGQSPLQSHPLLYFIIYPLSKVHGEVWAINLIGISLLVLRPLVVFFFSKKLFENQYFALLTAALDSFFPAYYEIYSWGGYPNLLGFIMLPIALMYILESSSIKLKRLIFLFVISALTVISHNLTSIMFIVIVYLSFLQKLLERQYKSTFLILMIISLPVAIHRLLVSGFSEYILFNEFAYYASIVNAQKLLYIFKNPLLLFILIILSAIGIFNLYKTNKRGAVLLVSWLLSPIIFYIVVYYTRLVVIDYLRLFFFIVQPLIISTVYSLKTLWEKEKLLSLGLVCLLIFSTLNYGYICLHSAISWNKANMENAYDDTNSYDMVMWVKTLSNDSVIVSRALVINRFIEGIAHKRVLGGGLPRFLFKLNEYERQLATDILLTSNILASSDMFKIKDQTPILFRYTPKIYVFAGDNYKILGYFSDHYPYELKKLTLNVSEISFGNNSYTIKYLREYEHYPTVETLKKIIIGDDEFVVNYTILGKDQVKWIANMSLVHYFWLPWDKNWDFVNNTLYTDYGDVHITSNVPIEKEYISKWKQWRLVFSFDDELTVSFKVENVRMVRGDVVLTTRDDLIDFYNVTHALVRVDDKEAMNLAETLNWNLAYNNSLFYLYEVSS